MKLNNDVKELNVNEVEVKEVLLEEVTTSYNKFWWARASKW